MDELERLVIDMRLKQKAYFAIKDFDRKKMFSLDASKKAEKAVDDYLAKLKKEREGKQLSLVDFVSSELGGKVT